MEHQDAEVSDVIIVLKAECCDKLDETADELKKLGMEIEKTDADNGIVEGTLGADKVGTIRKWPCVDYVRVDFTYIADYPPGDPRNLDPPEELMEDSED